MESDSSAAHSLLEKSIAIILKTGDESDHNLLSLLAVIRAARKLKDDGLTREAIDGCFDISDRLYADDTNPDQPNRHPMDQWPSVHAYRVSLHTASEVYGMGAAAYLAKIRNPDLLLFSQVSLAAGLLDRSQPDRWIVTPKHEETGSAH